MSIDPRAVCVVGVAQRVVRPDEAPSPEPLDLWEDVARRAAADSGSDRVLRAVDGVQVVFCQSWDYDDPTGRLAHRLGVEPSFRRYSGIGGTTPQTLVDQAAGRLGRGETRVELLCMAEALATVTQAWKTTGAPPAWSYKPPMKVVAPFEGVSHPYEKAHNLRQAWLTFALRDNARRAALGIDLDTYRKQLAEMMSGLTETAASNPYAWFPFTQSPADLGEPGPKNRYVAYPYTKKLCSMIEVDLAAAVVVMSHAAAEDLGVPVDRRVYLHSAAYGEDPVNVAEHPELGRSVALPVVAGRALAGAGVGIDDVAHLDLYSCFPSSLNFARDALGLAPDDERPLTVTGGLPYAGGAGSGYLLTSLAAMTQRLRQHPGDLGLLSGVGMHMTKHVHAIYGARPPVPGPTIAELGAVVDAPKVLVQHHEGKATIAATAVVHGRDGEPAWAPIVADIGAGRRVYALITDAEWLREAEAREVIGDTVRITPDPRGFNVAYGG